MPIYLSWDCANRTLAYCLIKIEGSQYEILDGQVVDILGQKVDEVDEHTRAKRLADWLALAPISADKIPAGTIVIIEKQPQRLGRWGGATTYCSTAVANQLLFYYCKSPCHFIDPKEKNKIALTPELVFVDDPKAPEHRRKTARKQHATANLQHIIDTCPCKLPQIKKSLMNHLADAAIQAIAFDRKNQQ